MQVVTANDLNQLDGHLRNAFNNNEDYEITLTSSLYIVGPDRADSDTYNPSPIYPYGPPGPERSSLPRIKTNVTIKASDGQFATITRDTNATGTYRHFYVINSGSLTLERLVIEKGDVGSADTGGGAIRSLGSVTIRNCRLGPDNKSNYGGALDNGGGTAVIENCDIFENDADWGGGFINGDNGSMTITNSRFAGNSSSQSWAVGGGIANFGNLTVTHCCFIGNTAATGGAVASYNNGNANISKSIMRLNDAWRAGGAIFVKQGGQATVECSTMTGNTSPDGPVAWIEEGGSVTISKTSLPEYNPNDSSERTSVIGNMATATNPSDVLPPRCASFELVFDTNSGNLVPVYQYNREEIGTHVSQFSGENFHNFPQDSASSVVGYIDADTSRARRDYSSVLFHDTPDPNNPRTGSAVFISEMIHYGGIPMSIDDGDDPDAPDCTTTDQTTGGTYDVRGWRYCPPETSSTKNWKHHPSIITYFDSLPGGDLIGTVTTSEIEGVIWTTEVNGFAASGTLKGDPDDPNDPNAGNFANIRNKFAPSGNLASVSVGDYLYIVSHGFVVAGWGPFLGTIDGISYALDNNLATTRSNDYPIPYVADFCYGTDGTPDGTGWLQDPRPRPFYAAATRVFESWLRSDQIAYLKKRIVPGLSTEPISVYDNFVAENGNWHFYKIPDSIALSILPLNRLYFCG
jgi:hypothetical protein